MRKPIVQFVLVVLAAAGAASSQTVWSKYAGNPVLGPGSPGTWDRNGAGIVSVLNDRGVFKAWYVGIDDSAGRIGYATSLDGLTWNRHPTPVLGLGNPGAWDDTQADHACVLLVGGTYRMWYSGEDGLSSRIGYATSADGITWQKYAGNPILGLGAANSWEESEVFHPSVLFDGQTYHMWYNGYGLNAQRTGYATSLDGISWTRYPGNPVLNLGPAGSFDDYMLALMAVIRKDGIFHMWYTGGDGTDADAKYFRIGYATSPDGKTWTKNAANPVLNLGPAGAWDSLGVVTSCVMYDSASGTFRMWYGGLNGSRVATGYAASGPAVHADESPETLPPPAPVLHQNYPNPFNPGTAIRYGLPKRSYVRLTVFNTLGQHIATLVEGEQEAGYHEVMFDASGLASGIHLCRLQAGDFAQTRRLLLLR